MKRAIGKVNRENLRILCYQRGFKGVPGLVEHLRKIGKPRNRVTLYAAVRNPRNYGPTYRLMEELLK